ncbi:MAG: Fur family transcriptional regulator [Dehalococcoidales bacterium]|nr:Fur family transcriptional regulator [Dehalococcoidales bacterium]
MKSLAAELRRQGYKMTPQRRAILGVIALSHEHLSPAAIYGEVHHKHPEVGRVTVYRTLEILVRLGLICEVHTGSKERSFILRAHAEHHHHLVCSGCGKVVDFESCNLGKLEKKLSRETGFAIDDHLLELHGRCPQCAGAGR